jgi:enoyl-CoA hydratase
MIERANEGDVAVLRLAHGPVSAMDIELCQEITATFRALADDLAEGAPYVERFIPALCAAFRAVFELGKPVVAAVNGHAIAGGCVLALCADLTVMAEGDGRIGIPEVKVGVPFPRVPLEVVRYAVGHVTSRRLVVGARTYPAAEARSMNLIDEIVSADELLPRAAAAARAMADEIPADTFAATKGQLRRESRDRMDRYADEDAEAVRLWSERATDGWTARYLESVTRR